MQVFGVSPGSLYGDAVFGTGLYGVDEDVWTDGDKQITESLTLSDSQGVAFTHSIFDAISLSSAVNPVMKAWGIWDYVFPGPTTEGEDQDSSAWDNVDTDGLTWTDVSDTSRNWTDV